MALHVLRCAAYSALGAARRRPGASPFTDAITPIYVPLRALDAFGHVNNTRYLEFFEFARWERGVRHGMLGHMLKNKCIEVVGTSHVQYMKEMKAWRFVNVRSEYIGVSGRAVVLQQTLEGQQPHQRTGRPTVYAVGIFKMTFLQQGKPLEFKDVCHAFGCPEEYERIVAASKGADGPLPHLRDMHASDDAWRAALRPPKGPKPPKPAKTA